MFVYRRSSIHPGNENPQILRFVKKMFCTSSCMLRTGLTFMCVVFLVYPVIGNPLLEVNVELACIYTFSRWM